MSVLNQSGEEQVECPLCMEQLEVDDLTFFPCTCGYQICRFCWHRIRLDENGGLCPACRKAYSENPADFIPLSREQVAKLKAEKRQRNQQRKAILSENRKHLASVRVVQRNLVFVVGLPPRLADPEILKRHEYFGKFGKIHKVVINQSTSYAGSQGPSASAYVTYLKSDDALRAIQAVNNVTIDNRVIKSSLGTTKYCSHFMKNQACPKPDCMYLHEYGDNEASFTREQMHQGKHQEYEKKLHEDLLARSKAQNGNSSATDIKVATVQKNSKEPSIGSNNVSKETNGCANKDGWPQLDKDIKKAEKDSKSRKGKTKNGTKDKKVDGCKSSDSRTTSTSSNSSHTQINKLYGKDSDISPGLSAEPSPSSSPPTFNRSNTPSESSSGESVGMIASTTFLHPNGGTTSSFSKLPPNLCGRSEDSNSYFSSGGFMKLQNSLLDDDDRKDSDEPLSDRLNGEQNIAKSLADVLNEEHGHQVLTDSLPNISTSQDWEAAFGFAAHQQDLLQHKAQQQRERMAHYSNFLPLDTEPPFNKSLDSFNGFYDRDNLTTSKPNGYMQQQNGLDHNMSKFFSDFHKFNNNNHTKDGNYQNGFSTLHYQQQQLLQQRQLEDQFRSLGLKQQQQSSFNGAQSTVYQNGYTNGDVHINGMYSKPPQPQNSRNSEAELDFDPFQETQKGLAELLANEQKLNQGRLNGLVHTQNGTNNMPPPPPGFMQQQTHMNSFGSKILPYLCLSNGQQSQPPQINTPPNWSSSLNLQAQKNVTSTCNDWKVLDPAILSSGRTIQMASSFGGAAVRPPQFDYPSNNVPGGNNNPFSVFAQQLQQQPSYNSYAHLNGAPHAPAVNNLNWFTAPDINSQISSPPGFRSSQTSKQQEC